MSFEIIATEPFERRLKRLAKKYKSIKLDVAQLLIELADNPKMGSPLGKDCYKIRLNISAKAKGKSGGGRVITCVRILKNRIFLMDIFDKFKPIMQ